MARPSLRRAPGKDIVLSADTTISRSHARLTQENGTVFVTDNNSSNGTGRSPGHASADGGADRARIVATSPAGGFFQPGPRAASGTKVRSGDSLGTINVIGVPQDVLAPVDGIVGSTLVESGTAVEYGQELIRIELSAPASAAAEGR